MTDSHPGPQTTPVPRTVHDHPGTAQVPPPAPAPLIIPGRRLAPSPDGARRLRRATTVVGAAAVVLGVLG
ncbi:MAG: hypothetical protein L0H74_04225, partial [Brachybacterium sp.]|nr:hypothetical protein [Brachybacterium sp.]